MDINAARSEIADAITAADPIFHGYVAMPATFKDGDSWPIVESIDRGPANDFEVTWRIIVVLPQTEPAAMEWFGAYAALLAESLAQVGYVERIEPGNLATEQGVMNCMIITMTREA